MKYICIDIPTSIPETKHSATKLASLQHQIVHDANNAQSAYAFAHNLDDTTAIDLIKKTIHSKKQLNPSILIVIGIGGSNLGTRAVQEALLGSLCNKTAHKTAIYYADTVDTDYIGTLLNLTETALKKGDHIVLNVISKSGNTTETIALFELFLAQLKQYLPTTYVDHIVCTTDAYSPLHLLATKHGWTTLEIPPHIGGRYSVFTAVGLFPLGMIGIDIDSLMQGARTMRDICLQDASPATKTAAWFYALAEEKYFVANLFLFSNELRSCGDWWRQLVGESLGKAHTLTHTPNTKPIIPITSIGTTDLHSVGQLYFADIANIATQFVTIQSHEETLILPAYKEFEHLVPHIQQKSIAHIMHAIVTGVQKAYALKNMPYCTVTLPEKNAYYIGQLLIYKMLETVFLAHLLEVNAFDQPEVETYKKEVRAILAQDSAA
jgi:glucose-6-phosphate isomerase